MIQQPEALLAAPQNDAALLGHSMGGSMTRDDIIRMAREAGGFIGELPRGDAWLFLEEEYLERFAALVAAAEREHCAKLVEPTDEHRRDASWGYLGGEEGVELLDEIAAAIRSRSINV